MSSCKTQLESKSRCKCQNMKWFFADANTCRHSLENRPEMAKLGDFKSPAHTHNPELQSNFQISLLYTRAKDTQNN